MITNLVLLAGGLATRLQPVSQTIPKSLIDINGQPFIAHQLTLLKEQGITDIVICAGYLGEQIEKFVGNGHGFGLNIKYSYDGEKLLGTAGAIKKAFPLLPETFFVMYGDSYLPIDFEQVSNFFESQNRQALMTIIENNNQWDKSNVIFSDGQITKYDKKDTVSEMRFIDYGLGIMTKKCFNNVIDNEVFDLASIYQSLVKQDELAGYDVKERFYEIGSFSGIEEFKKYIN